MKILLATPIYPPEIGGPATYIKELCERWHDKHDLMVIAYTNNQTSFANTRLIAVPKNLPMILRLALYTWRLLWIVRSYDVVYVQNAMAAGLPVVLACSLLHVPFVLKFVGDEAWERASQLRLTHKKLEEFLTTPEGNTRIRLMMRIQGFVLRRASIVTTPSAYLTEEIIKTYGVPRSKTVVNYNAADKTETIPFDQPQIPHQIVTTARLVTWKGVDGIIRAVHLIKGRVPDIRLIVAGDGPEMKNLQDLATSLGLTDNIIFKGNVSRTETWQLRKTSSVYVLNSTYEGLPHVVLTSFAAMIPVIATDISGTNEAVYHEKTGLLVKPGDDKALAEAIMRIFTDPTLSSRLVKNGADLLKTKFSWSSHLAQLSTILDSVVSKPLHQSR